jgi:hypothetical protein
MFKFFLFRAQDLKEQIANKESYTIYTAGVSTFFYTTLLLVVFYHFYVFWIESLGAVNIKTLLITTLASVIFTLTAIGLIQFLSAKTNGE